MNRSHSDVPPLLALRLPVSIESTPPSTSSLLQLCFPTAFRRLLLLEFALVAFRVLADLLGVHLFSKLGLRLCLSLTFELYLRYVA